MSGKVSARRTQKYRKEYKEQFPSFTASTKGEEYAYCIYCRQDLKISGGGANDITRHISKQKHRDNEQAEVNASKICMLLDDWIIHNVAFYDLCWNCV